MEEFKAGTPLNQVLTAKNLNRFVKTVNIVEGGRIVGSGASDQELRAGEIYTYFGSGAHVTVAPYRAVAISGAMVASGELGTLDGSPCCSGAVISSGAAVAHWGIAQDAIATGDLASGGIFLRTKVHGITPAWIDVKDVSHRHVNAGGAGGALVSDVTGPAIIIGVPVSTGEQYLPILLGAGSGGGVMLAVVTTPPTSGGGVGAVAPVVVGSGGELTRQSGAEIPVIFPFLDGYN